LKEIKTSFKKMLDDKVTQLEEITMSIPKKKQMDERLTWPGTWQVQKTKGMPDLIATRKQNLR
jgi:hypothetical protein